MKHYGFEIENEIFWSGLLGSWEKESLKLWIQLSKKSQVVLDIGANTGIYSLIAKTMNPQSTVYAFEPVERVFQKLKENIQLNYFDIIPVQKALSNKNGTAIIFDTPTEHTYSVTVNKNLTLPGTAVLEKKIETITLDSFIQEYTIKKIDLIKLDVETHEPEVLEGFANHLSTFRPTFLIEILNDEVAERVGRMVQGMNYLFFNIDEKGGIRQVQNLTKSDYYNFLICDQRTAEELGLLKPTLLHRG